MQDPLNAMQIFMRVAESQSFTQAANDLALSKTHVSNRVAQLERWAGARLLQRTTRSVSLTLDGQQFYLRCQQMLDEVQELESLFKTSEAALTGKLRIDMPTGLAKNPVLPHLPAFLEAHPGLDVELSCTDRRVDMVSEGFDAVVRGGPVRDQGVIARHLLDIPQMNFASPAYIARFGKPETLEDLAKHQVVHYTQMLDNSQGEFEYQWQGERKTLPMASRVTVNSAEAYLQACLAGLGIIQRPRLAHHDLPESQQLIPILTDYVPPPMPLWLLYPHRRHLSKRLQVFSDWLSQLLSNAP
ncbi:LysR family transcriptional regulator [Gallaecimonas mangrovi]|uniref:LysR family transcriptional regulator n=1 Tax=Gallaecimonas mangrovi TaxID=2291597 RepID=UPI000E1FC2AB|nr:LysR family transcriptional regulator [Gallaecimonas mangrovi]